VQTGIRHRVADRSAVLETAFSADYRTYQYRFVEFFIEHMADLSRTFRGDLQQMIVLALIGQVTLRAYRAAEIAGEDPSALPEERFVIAAARIADVTGIPRETVRRKLAALERRKWVVQAGDGGWRLATAQGVATVLEDLAEIDRRSMQRVARMVAELERFA
jgi:hypothetical protein